MYCLNEIGEKFMTGQTITEEELVLARVKNVNVNRLNLT
jgi:hypothetical protein